jgi:SAM-dependent methyltransferase
MQKQEKISNYFSSVSLITNTYYKKFFSKYIDKKFKILDFGCGSGELLDLIDCKFKIGVEINKYSQKKLKNKNLMFVDKLEKIDKKIKFDTIFCLSVLDHLDDPLSTLKKIKDRLKKNGKLIVIIRNDSRRQNIKNSIYKNHLYSWSLLSFNNLINNIGIKSIDEGMLRFTLPPRFNFLNKNLKKKTILFLSKIYFYINFRDIRFYFICQKK